MALTEQNQGSTYLFEAVMKIFVTELFFRNLVLGK